VTQGALVEMVLRDSARDVVSSVASCWPDRVVTCRFIAVPDVLEDPDFEVQLLEIHTVKIYEMSMEGAECLALPYGIVGMSENIQDFG